MVRGIEARAKNYGAKFSGSSSGLARDGMRGDRIVAAEEEGRGSGGRGRNNRKECMLGEV